MRVIRWGIREGKQRFKCKSCGILFTLTAPQKRLENRFVWFRKWIMERQTYSTLSRDSRLSKSSLQRLFYTYPDLSPEVKIIKRSAVNIQIDATCFKQFCVLCYQDNEDGCTQLIRIIDGEHYSEIKEDLDNLITLGVQIKSITTDRRKSALKAIRTSLPDVTVQRCFVHIQ